MSEGLKDVLEQAQAAIWDAYYGRCLTVEYARVVSAKIDTELKRARQLERQRDEAVKLRAEEIAEFNAGCDAYKNGVRFEAVEVGPHDQTGIGYAWAAFDDLRKQRDEAVQLLRDSRSSVSIDAGISGSVHRADDLRKLIERIDTFLATLDRTEKT
jgi:hypothetical protein